jgi:hypothetical protein
MIGLPSLHTLDRAQSARIWLAAEATDMRWFPLPCSTLVLRHVILLSCHLATTWPIEGKRLRSAAVFEPS